MTPLTEYQKPFQQQFVNKLQTIKSIVYRVMVKSVGLILLLACMLPRMDRYLPRLPVFPTLLSERLTLGCPYSVVLCVSHLYDLETSNSTYFTSLPKNLTRIEFITLSCSCMSSFEIYIPSLMINFLITS